MLPLLSDILNYEIEISATDRLVLIAAVAVVGATLGSFMNVVVYRLPRRMSLSRPASRCPKCEHPIRWHDNVPVLGWLMLRGRCRDCSNPIAARYPLVEGFVALVAGAIAWRAPYMVMIAPTADEDGVYVLDWSWIVFYLLLSCVLICAALIEFDGLASPRRLVLRPLIAGFLLLIFWAHLLTSPWAGSLSANAGGVAAGFLGLLAALLLSVGPGVALLATTAQARTAWAAAAIGELILVGAFVGEQRIVWLAPGAMLLYVATACLACLAQKWPVAGRFGWACSLTVVTLIWLLGGDFVAALSIPAPQANVIRLAIAFSLMLLLAIVPVVLPRKPPQFNHRKDNTMARLTFHGAAETVTGSKYLLEAEGRKVLIDCGLFQGLKELRLRNWQRLPFDPSSLDAVVLTHAHIDHVGYLPKLVKDGFRGPVYSTPATESLAGLLLLDAAHNQQDDADYANRKGFSKHKPALPLFEAADVKQAMTMFRGVHREKWFSPAEPIWMRYHDTGHLLGSCMIEVEVRSGAKPLRLLFSGDVGRYDAPLYFDPEKPPTCDYLVCESTYGNREHEPIDVLDQLSNVVNTAIARGGMILVASFAVGRAQQVIYLLQVLIKRKRIPPVPVFLDSPMAVSGMNIYRYYASEHDLSEGLATTPDFELSLEHVQLVQSVGESKKLNGLKGPGVIISSSGMMTGGRILHHLRQRLPDAKNTVVLGGFMAQGTRGRALQEGAKTLRIFGADVPVRAAVVEMSGLSGHAGHSELRRWLEPLAAPRQVFLTHGELPSATSLAEELHRERGWNTLVPKMGQSVELVLD